MSIYLMGRRVRRWRRRTALATLAGVTALAALAMVPAVAAVSGRSAKAPATPVRAAATPRVPWAKVGPGWELVQYTAASPPMATPVRKAPTYLYLVAPGGARYVLYTWPKTVRAPYLIAWSGDKTRALLSGSATGQVVQVNLVTGKAATFTLAGRASAIGYTRPAGQNILGYQQSANSVRFARYSLTGKLLKVLFTSPYNWGNSAVYSSDGTMLAIGDSKGLVLVSNAGGVIRRLPVRGVAPSGCQVARWWDARTVLASCTAKGSSQARLFLVPVSGKTPAALTPQRGPKSPDLGDLNAWRLPSGLYLQAAGGCGSLQVYRQAANGSITPVIPPKTTGNNNWIVTVSGDRMLLRAQTGCPGSMSLLWYNPRTRAEQWLLRTPSTQWGVQAVEPYYSREASNFF